MSGANRGCARNRIEGHSRVKTPQNADLEEPSRGGSNCCISPWSPAAKDHRLRTIAKPGAPLAPRVSSSQSIDFLSWLAGRTKRIKLGPGVIIVPWNDPYRAASHLVMLDYLSNGRAMIGLGRGLAASACRRPPPSRRASSAPGSCPSPARPGRSTRRRIRRRIRRPIARRSARSPVRSCSPTT